MNSFFEARYRSNRAHFFLHGQVGTDAENISGARIRYLGVHPGRVTGNKLNMKTLSKFPFETRRACQNFLKNKFNFLNQ